MYESHYGLSVQPFKLTPDPGFYFGSKQHRRARAYLDYGVTRREGFIVITGDVGAGKTTVLRSLIQTLDARQVVTAHLVSTQLDDNNVLRAVAAAFGIRVRDLAKADLLGSLEAFFISHTMSGRRCLLIVDEAQNLTLEAVEELRMLSNFQIGQQALLQSFLVGQPEFRRMLADPAMEQFRQRVTATCHIGPLDADDVRGYIEHRLKAAGSRGQPSFDDELFALLHQASGGIPRRINAHADRLLLSGFLAGKLHFTAQDMQAVIDEFHAETGGPTAHTDAFAVGPQADHPELRTRMNPAQIPTLTVRLSGSAALDTAAVGALQHNIGQALAGHDEDRLARIERSLVELDRINRQTLALMHGLVQALVAGAPRPDAPVANEPIAPAPEAFPKAL